MKLQVSVNKKVGVINITSNSFILEDLKAHICKKMKLKESDFKMKFDFGNSSIELVENVNLKVISIDLNDVDFLSSDEILPNEFKRDFYKIKHKKKCLKVASYNEHWIDFIKETKANEIIEIYENIRKDGLDHSVKLLYKIRVTNKKSMQSEQSVKAFFES